MPHTMKPAGMNKFIRSVGGLCLAVICIANSAFGQDADVDAVVDEQAATSEAAQQSQELIDSLDESISDDIAATRVARQQTDRLLIVQIRRSITVSEIVSRH